MRRTDVFGFCALWPPAGWLAAVSPPAPRAPPDPFTERSRDRTANRWRPSSSSCATTSRDSSPRPPRARTGPSVLFNIPFNPYELHVEVQGFRPVHQNLDVRTSIPQEVVIQLELPAVSESVSVMGEPTAAQLETDTTTSHIDIDKSYIARAPAAIAMRAMEEIVTSTPGFALDENGRYHFQGAHSQSEYVIDGQTISDQTGVTFSNSIDPGIAQSLEVIYGNVPAEFGEKVGAVINMTTKSGLGAPFKGSAIGSFATFDTYQGGVSLGGGTDRFGVFASVNAAGSDYFTDPVNPDNLHNVGQYPEDFPAPRHGIARLLERLPLLRAPRSDGPGRHQHLHAGDRRPGARRQDLRPELQPRLAERRLGRLRRRRDRVRAAGEVHPLSFRRRHSHHVELEPLARQLRHHALLHLDDRHSRDQGGRRLQAVSDQRALPVRDHRPDASTIPIPPTTTRTSLPTI